MTFVARILERLSRHPDHVFLREARPDGFPEATGAELARHVRRVRGALREAGVDPGDRVAVLAANSIAWVAADLALLAEGALGVPLYPRARPAELGRILADCEPVLLLADAAAAGTVAALRTEGAPVPRVLTLEDLLVGDADADGPPRADADAPHKIFYTSGTSGEPKGVVLTAANVEPVLQAAVERLDGVVRGLGRDGERVFHYLPFCFAGSWIALLACLDRRATLTLNTDVTRLVEDLASVRPHWFQNVPVVLDRVRHGVECALRRRSGPMQRVFHGAWSAVRARHAGRRPRAGERLAHAIARRLLFPAIRTRIGPELRALVCGSAPLSEETQLFFEMISLPVLQVYGLTETSAICTMDTPRRVAVGRVGQALDGVEMRISGDGEIQVRGPNVFAGYWRNEAATQAALVDGWLRTGDRGEVDDEGRWRILGRVKDLLVPTSGHKIAPEPLEGRLAALLPGALQVVLLGDGRPRLVAVVTGDVDADEAEAAVEELNRGLPHYAKIGGSLLSAEAFTVESGLLTANGKLRRVAIAERFAAELDALFEREAVGA